MAKLLATASRDYGSLGHAAPPKRQPQSLASRLLFSFADPIMRDGNKRQLRADDLWELDEVNTTEVSYRDFRRHYDASGAKSIATTCWHTYGTAFALCGLGSLFSVATSVFAPAVLHHVVDAFTAPQVAMGDLSIWLGVFFASKILNAFISAHSGYWLSAVMLRLSVSLKSLLFEKALRCSVQGKTRGKAIEIANLFASDVASVLWAAADINNLWLLPLQIAVVIYMLYAILDLAAFAGLAAIGLSMAASFRFSKWQIDSLKNVMERRDARMKAVKEVFSAIQVVKFNAWESKFAQRILALRALEIKALSRFVFFGASTNFVLWASPLVVSMSSFAVYSIVLKQQLTAAKIFTAMALFNALREPLRRLPSVVSLCLQAKVSIGPMQVFLSSEEYASSNVIREGSLYGSDVAIKVEDGSFGWTTDSAILKNVNLTIKTGDFVVVHGPVGSGKSSLCSALLGEMDKLSGSVFVRGRVAYYSQQAWIQNMTIRDNILFGKAYDDKLYKQVLDACGLLPDLDQFPAGDATEIGQKGINLSGGQKARLCLARACYADADVVILDSPLAAVDAVVQTEIFSKCLCTLLESKTVVLVTHAPDVIGSDAVNYEVEIVDGVANAERRKPVGRRSSYATQKITPLHGITLRGAADAGRLVTEEAREQGRVSKKVFLRYFNAMGGVPATVFVFLVVMLWQACQISSDFWLSHWTNTQTAEYDAEETQYNMGIYTLLGMGSVVMVFLRSMTFAVAGINASNHLFTAMTNSLLRSPLRFFDANPIGRIINRYGDDMMSVDFRLPFNFGGFLATFFFTACQLSAAIYTVNFLGVLVLPLLYIYVKTANYYLAPSRELSRLARTADSPVLSHVTGSEQGVVLLRAFGPDYIQRAAKRNFELNDAGIKASLSDTVMTEWFQLRMQLIGAGVVVVVVSGLVYLHAYLTPGIVGLAFSYALSVDGGLSGLVAAYSRIDILMVSPERVLEYASLPAEDDGQLIRHEPPMQWPQRGTIEFEKVVFSYKDGAPAVLKGLSFAIKINEKIGIVGRTGAGKSSLTMALFRINELVSGRIMIDGEDISKLPLPVLRSHLSIIPQSPVLFKGPLRAYMDPFDEFSDAEIWDAFKKVEMKEQIAALEGQLSFELSENGDNFSVGERQMLCLARAMLTKSRIVIMDEATASIDHATEKKLQHMINRDFQDATVLTIAHRLATVLDSDRIIVLSDGHVVEFDTPANLVKNEKGVFYELANEGGVLDKIRSEN